MTAAMITPSVLSWARKREGLSQQEVADFLNVKAEAVQDWELGDAKPTLRQAANLARRLRIPLGYLFLNEPPALGPPLPDLRTVHGRDRFIISPDLREVINSCIIRQEWYREHLIAEGLQPLPFVGKFKESSSFVDVAKDITATLSALRFPRKGSHDRYRRDLTHGIEDLGVSVLRSTYVGSHTKRPLSVDEFRGFAIVDDIAPLIFVNGRDATSAQIFTMIHELAHIWVGAAGISDLEAGSPSRYPIEMLCNSVAAEVLVPKAELARQWKTKGHPAGNIARLATYFKVSELVVLRRARELEHVTAEFFAEYYKAIRNRKAAKEARSSSGPHPYRTIPARIGEHVSTAILVEALSGRLPVREAADMLHVKPPALPKVAEEVGLS